MLWCYLSSWQSTTMAQNFWDTWIKKMFFSYLRSWWWGHQEALMPLFSYLCFTQTNFFLRCSYGVLLVQGKEVQMHIILRTKTNKVIATIMWKFSPWQMSHNSELFCHERGKSLVKLLFICLVLKAGPWTVTKAHSVSGDFLSHPKLLVFLSPNKLGGNESSLEIADYQTASMALLGIWQ